MTWSAILLPALALALHVGAIASAGAAPPAGAASPDESPRISNLQLWHPMALVATADAGGPQGAGVPQGAGPTDEPFSNIPSDAFVLGTGSKRVKKDLSRALQSPDPTEDGELPRAIVFVVSGQQQGPDSPADPEESLEVFSASDYRDLADDGADAAPQHTEDEPTPAQGSASDDWTIDYLRNPIENSIYTDQNRDSKLYENEINDLIANELQSLESMMTFVNRGSNTEPAQPDSHSEPYEKHGSSKRDNGVNNLYNLFAKTLGALAYHPMTPFVNRGSNTEPAQSDLLKDQYESYKAHAEPRAHHDRGSNKGDYGVNKERYDSNKQHYYTFKNNNNKISYGHDHYGSNKEHYGPNHYDSNKEHYGPNHYDSNKEHYGPNNHYVSVMGDYDSTKNQYGWNRDEPSPTSAEMEHSHHHHHHHHHHGHHHQHDDDLVGAGSTRDGYFVFGDSNDQIGQPFLVV